MSSLQLGAYTLSEKDYRRFRDFLYAETGIFLSPAKKALLVGRLSRRLRELGISSLSAYYEYLQAQSNFSERTQFFNLLTTNETHFFREPVHFDFLREKILPAWRQAMAERRMPQRIRAWSAGCSSGEEPYSIAMCLHESLAGDQVEIEILATDLSSKVLAKAERAEWPLSKANEIPVPLLKKYMLKGFGKQEGKMRASLELKNRVTFRQANLMHDLPGSGQFDLVFCRNVLIYFDDVSKKRAIRRLLDHLAPNGYLFVGHSESLLYLREEVESVLPTIYRGKRPETRTLGKVSH